MNKLNFQAIAMRCTYEEYLSIRDFIVKHVDANPIDSYYFKYLTNYFNGGENIIGFVDNQHNYNREICEKFCAKTFLNACGFDVEQNAQLEWKVKWQLKDHAMPLINKENQEALIRNIPDVADIYWELEELKSKYADAKEELLQIRFNDEVYKLNEQIKVLNKENDKLSQEIKELKDHYNKKETPIEPKFEVIEIYPDSPFKIGDTLERRGAVWGTGESQKFVRYPHFFPNLFKQIN